MMDETTKNTTTDGLSQLAQLGMNLKNAREAMQLSEKDAATRLHLSTKFIDMMENGTSDEKLPPTFLRGYLRSYARMLNINEEEVNIALGSVVEAINVPQQPFSPKKRVLMSDNTTSTERYITLITYLIPFILLVLVGIWWSSHSRYSVSDVPATSQTHTETKTIPLENTQAVAPVVTDTKTNTPGMTPIAQPQPAATTTAPVPAAATTTPAATTAAPAVQSQAQPAPVAAPVAAPSVPTAANQPPVAQPTQTIPLAPIANPTPDAAATANPAAESTEPTAPVKRKKHRRAAETDDTEDSGLNFLND